MVIRLTPNGFCVSALVPRSPRAAAPGVIEPQAMTPKPPALEIAATRCRSLTQLIAPPMMASGDAEKIGPALPQTLERRD